MTIERWKTISKHDQILHIGSEILRTSVWQKSNDRKSALFSINEAIHLIALTLQDPKWKDQNHLLMGLIREIKKYQTGEQSGDIQIIYQSL